MKIVVIGGTGLIGSRFVPKLRERGHEAIAASPQSGVNSVTGEGLAEALKGASVVVDVSNAPSWEDAAVMKFFEASTRNLLSQEATAHVGHHVALSVVGSERMQESGYFRAKIAQENLIKASSILYSIVRATQFFEFVKAIADFSSEGKKCACHMCFSSRWQPTMSQVRYAKWRWASLSMARLKLGGRNGPISMNSSGKDWPQARIRAR